MSRRKSVEKIDGDSRCFRPREDERRGSATLRNRMELGGRIRLRDPLRARAVLLIDQTARRLWISRGEVARGNPQSGSLWVLMEGCGELTDVRWRGIT